MRFSKIQRLKANIPEGLLDCRPDFVIDTTFDLFVDLGATDEQCDFPVVYASGANGIAGNDPTELAENLEPLFECIVREVSAAEKICCDTCVE